MELSLPNPARQKELGAFYTPGIMAAALNAWAIREPDARVLDPSFGGLAFLDSAAQRLLELGTPDSSPQLFGVDVDEDAFAAAAAHHSLGLDPSHLVRRSFFDVVPERDLPLCDAVVGNPPYVRYQGWDGAQARALCAAAGVKLTRLASTWAPFVVHATAFVRSGGRLAMVLPAEILHAQYAKEVVAFLERSFARVRLAVFEERVFPGALEEVVLLCAEGRGVGQAQGLELVECQTLKEFAGAMLAAPDQAPTQPGTASPHDGRGKLLSQLLAQETREIYGRVQRQGHARPIGDFASVDIGAVTGANEFFLLDEATQSTLGPDLSSLCVSKASHIRGARLTESDVTDLRERGARLGLLTVNRDVTRDDLPETLQKRLTEGEAAGLHRRYKCRVRSPWWVVPVPGDQPPDLFLTYFASAHPRLVTNDVGARHTNTLHGVRLLTTSTSAASLAAGFINSLTLLSAELVGRSYGGGVLKLEPTEAEAVLLPPVESVGPVELAQVDALMRQGELDAALDVIDPLVLGQGLGLDEDEIHALRTAAEKLRDRRRARGRRLAD